MSALKQVGSSGGLLGGQGRIRSLDGLRAVSILMVLLSHAVLTQGFPVPRPYRDYLQVGDVGVRVFFVISGYLITSLLLREMNNTGGIHLAKFYFRRALRIFPPFYVYVLAIVLLRALGVLWFANDGQGWGTSLLTTVTYLRNYFVNPFDPNDNWYFDHAWSLSVEEQFYLLWPTLLLFFRRKAFWVAAAALVVCPLVHLAYVSSYSDVLLAGAVRYRFEVVADAIACGCLLAGGREWLDRSRLYTKLLGSKLMLAVPLVVFVADAVDTRTKIGPIGYGPVLMVAAFTVVNVGILLCVDWCLRHPVGRVGQLLNARPVVAIGVLSYSIYLWQELFLDPHSALLTFPWNLLPIVPVAAGSYFLIERPALGLRGPLAAVLFGARRERARPGAITETARA